MAHILTRSYALVDLTVTSTTNIFAKNWITAPSGAVGIVAQVIDPTSLAVYEMSAVPFAPVENITTFLTSITTSCTATGAYGGSTLPANAAMVEGSDSTVTNIYRQIADIPGIGGVSNPSSIQAWLGLEMFVYFGSERQTADTYALCFDENVRLGYTGAQGGVITVDNPIYSSSWQNGFQKYKDDDPVNNPVPLYTQQGSIIDIRCTNAGGIGVTNSENSFIYFNDSTYKGDGTINTQNIDNFGELRIINTKYTNWIGFGANNPGAKLYLKDVYCQELRQAAFFLPEPPTYTDGLFASNNAAGFMMFFSFGFNWEASVNGVEMYDDNGNIAIDALLGTGFSNNVIHCNRSFVDVTKYTAVFQGTGSALRELPFKVIVTDPAGNPIVGAIVNLTNQFGKALFTKTEINLTANINSTTETITFTDVHGMSVDDSFRLSTEELTVYEVVSTVQVKAYRHQNGTVALAHNAAQKLAVAEKGVTDIDGVINYDSESGEGKNSVVQETSSSGGVTGPKPPITGTNIIYTDFNMDIKFPGFKTYDAPEDMTGKVGKVIPITLQYEDVELGGMVA